MVDTLEAWNKKPREMFYYRQRFKNRVHNKLAAFFAREAAERGITKKVIAERLDKDPAQITRWLSEPANLTLDTISDLLFAMEAEPQPPQMVRWTDMPRPNYVDPLVSEIIGGTANIQPVPVLSPPGIHVYSAGSSNATPMSLPAK